MLHCRVTINGNVNVSDTDVNEFLVRQMSSLFHVEDIELMQVRSENHWRSSILQLTHCINVQLRNYIIMFEAATGAANGHYISKDWARSLAYFEISIAGTRCTCYPYPLPLKNDKHYKEILRPAVWVSGHQFGEVCRLLVSFGELWQGE